MAVTIRIRRRDIDTLGHVNNDVYPTYLEQLLTGLLQPVLADAESRRSSPSTDAEQRTLSELIS